MKESDNKSGLYLVSEDIDLVMAKWTANKGYNLPKPEFFSSLRDDFQWYLRKVFPAVVLDCGREIKAEMRSNIQKIGLPSISLDRVYFEGDFSLDVTRGVDNKLKNIGIMPRPGINTAWQIQEIVESGVKEAVLVDDVLFSGKVAYSIIDMLKDFNIKIPMVCTGVAIQDGITLLEYGGIGVRCSRSYGCRVIDQVCERDFYPGVPYSGRTVRDAENVGVPYIKPFGKPDEWASIPFKWQRGFSELCLINTARLFKEIESESDKMIRIQDLDRKVFGMRNTDQTRFVYALLDAAKRIQ
jgi:hypothetical protein